MSQIANNIIDRLKSELDIKTDKELCSLLGIKSNTLSTWKKRDTMDFNKVLRVCDENNLDLNLIFFNEEKEAVLSEIDRDEVPLLTQDLSKKVSLVTETKILNKNRNLGVFKIYSENGTIEGEKLVLTQKVIPIKLSKQKEYVIQLHDNTFLLGSCLSDHEKGYVGFVHIELSGSENVKNTVKIQFDRIENLWIVLDKIDVSDIKSIA